MELYNRGTRKISRADELMSGAMLMGNGNPEPESKIRQQPAKQLYLKPAFRFEQVFVVSALSCGKIQPTDDLCRLTRKAS